MSALAVETGLTSHLTGDAEVPGPGAPDGIGDAGFVIDPDAGTVCWWLYWEGIDEPAAAHIHAGAEGVAGPPLVTLQAPFEEGCVDGQDGTTLKAIVDTPSDYYVNIHTADYPDGAMRGQLAAEPIHLYFELDGSAEVPGPGDEDGDGRGGLDVSTDTGEVCYYLEVQRLGTPTAAHVHSGAVGVAGAVEIELSAPVDGWADGCVDGLDGGLLASIVADPAGYYVNVHTEAFTDGAIRGQLTTEEPPYPTTLFAGISGDEEVPGPGDPEIGGMVALDIDVHDGVVCAYWDVSGIDSATAAHIHEGAAGVSGPILLTLTNPFETVEDPCLVGLDSATAEAIVADPGAYYINVHTEAFPNGAGRGQLSTEPAPPPPCAAPEVCDGPLSPGDYLFYGFSRPLAFHLDEEWFATVPGDGFWLDHPSGETGIYVVDFGGIVGAPPCGDESTEIGISAEAVTTWLASHPALHASETTTTTLGGLEALQIDITGAVPAECEARPFLVSTAGSWFRIADGEFVRVIAQDVASTIIVFVDDFDGVDIEASLERAQPVLDSMEWEPLVPGEGSGGGDGGSDEGGIPDSAAAGRSWPGGIGLVAMLTVLLLSAAGRRPRLSGDGAHREY